jgi:HNH endonuclease
MSRTNRNKRNRTIKLAKFQNNLCFHCHEPLILLDPATFYKPGTTNQDLIASYDHVIPLYGNGTNRIRNIVIAHRRCNSNKGSTPPTPEMLERLDKLNEKRFTMIQESASEEIDQYVSSFIKPTRALHFLSNIVSELNEKEAHRMRTKINGNMQKFLEKLDKLRDIEDRNFRNHMFQLLLGEHGHEIQQSTIPSKYQDLMANIFKAAWNQKSGSWGEDRVKKDRMDSKILKEISQYKFPYRKA